MALKPNILLIMSDQHHSGMMGCAGHGVVRTPNLDRLAQRSVRFLNAYCPSPLCVPSRMSFMTSRYPGDLRVWNNSHILDSNVPTFAHGLSDAGYRTILAGRMHFVGHDQHHGFEERLVGDASALIPGSSENGLGPIDPITTRQMRGCVEVAGSGRTYYQAFDGAVADAAADVLCGGDSSRPFCLVAGLFLPHCPFICPKDLYDYYHDRVNIPEVPAGFFEEAHPFVRIWRQHRGFEEKNLSRDQIRAALAAYYGLVTLMDRHVGRMLDALAASGRMENTMVIYTSDHGEMGGDHGMWWKSNLYDGAAKVPMLISWPGHFEQGVVAQEVVNLLDMGPTLLDVAGAKPLPFSRGRSMSGLVACGRPGAASWQNLTFCEHYPDRGDPASRMVRRGPWKLNYYQGHARPQLFNVEVDPGEWNDLADDPSCAPIREELTRLVLTGWDGGQVERECAAMDADIELVARVGKLHKSPNPYYWRAPAGVNVFPEE